LALKFSSIMGTSPFVVGSHKECTHCLIHISTDIHKERKSNKKKETIAAAFLQLHTLV